MGNLGFPEPQVRSQLRLAAGDRFDFIDWQDDRDRLERFYRQQRRFAAQIATRRDDAEGVVLTYTIDAGPETRVRVMGTTLPDHVLREIETGVDAGSIRRIPRRGDGSDRPPRARAAGRL